MTDLTNEEHLRIVILEDVPDDAELEELELREGGLRFTTLRVDTREAFERSLDEFKPDVVIADVRLPAYSGREALEYTRLTHPQIPVIVATGMLKDEVAVELLKLGAKDYVLKDRLSRLVPAIKRAVGEERAVRQRKLAERLLRESESKLSSITASAQDAIVMMDPEGKISFWNPAAEKIFGYEAPEAMGQPLHELLLPERYRRPAQEGFDRFSETGVGPVIGKTLELAGLRSDGTEFPFELSLSMAAREGRFEAVGIIRDVTERKQAERALLRANRALTTLWAGNAALLRAADEPELLRQLCRAIVEQGGYRMAWVGYADDNPEQSVTPQGWAGIEDADVHALNMSWADVERGQGPMSRAIRSGEPQTLHDLRSAPETQLWHELARARGYVAVSACPLRVGQRVIGALGIYASETDAFDTEELALLEELAKDLAFGIENLRTHAERDRLAMQQARDADRLRKSLEQSIQTIADTVEARDPYTAGHQRRVVTLAVAIAHELGLEDEATHGIRLAASVHDLGKIRVPTEILAKPSRLSEIEFKLIQLHAEAGYEILKNVDFPWPIADIVRQHHERLDGSGYPQGLTGEAILLEARIVAVADVVEAMASHRPYRPALGLDAALAEIERGRGSDFDPAVVDVCLKLFRSGRFAF